MKRHRILLIAPNISRKMGGEAFKALEILRGLIELGHEVSQITHSRVRSELRDESFFNSVEFIEDDAVSRALWKLRLSWLLGAYSNWRFHQKAKALHKDEPYDVIHFTSPISPTLPYFSIPDARVVIGPLNGNLTHPRRFLYREKISKLLGAMIQPAAQLVLGSFFHGKKQATLMVSGGDRTIRSLKMGGCRSSQIVETLDAGVPDYMAKLTRIRHSSVNNDFLFVGRLVSFKGCDLAIKALVHAKSARLHIVGDGPLLKQLKRLAHRLQVDGRVAFHGWKLPGEELLAHFRHARALVLPSLAEANGMVVQEAMIVGLPVIALDWGGPQALLRAETGILIDPKSETQISKDIGLAMTTLASDPVKADLLSKNAREYAGSDLLIKWSKQYELLNSPR